MTKLSSRLDRVEEALTPKERMALCFGRFKSLDEDFQRQCEEYKALHGDLGKVTFIQIKDYSNKDESYEDFIKRLRKSTGKGNCFAWWQELSEDEEEKNG